MRIKSALQNSTSGKKHHEWIEKNGEQHCAPVEEITEKLLLHPRQYPYFRLVKFEQLKIIATHCLLKQKNGQWQLLQ